MDTTGFITVQSAHGGTFELLRVSATDNCGDTGSVLFVILNLGADIILRDSYFGRNNATYGAVVTVQRTAQVNGGNGSEHELYLFDNCVFEDNYARLSGGGMYCFNFNNLGNFLFCDF